MADVRFEFDDAGMYATFQAEGGPVGRDLMRRATRVQLAARRAVPKRTHRLERSIVKRTRHKRIGQGAGRGGDLTISVGSDLYYAKWMEVGTRPHVIRPRDPHGMLRFVVNGHVVFAKVVHHPGTHAYRYLRGSLPLAAVDTSSG